MSDGLLAAASNLAAAAAPALENAGLGDDPQTIALREFDPSGRDLAERRLAGPRRDLLEDLLDGVPGEFGETADSIRAADRHASWASYASSAWSAALWDRSAAASIVGPRGPIVSDDLAFGIYCVGPDAVYPEHGHAARETYLILSGSTDFLTAEGWRTLSVGQASLQEPGVSHALRTGDQGILCFWVWSGDVTSPIWGLDENGSRFHPQRLYE